MLMLIVISFIPYFLFANSQNLIIVNLFINTGSYLNRLDDVDRISDMNVHLLTLRAANLDLSTSGCKKLSPCDRFEARRLSIVQGLNSTSKIFSRTQSDASRPPKLRRPSKT